jgi:hypothetical protein
MLELYDFFAPACEGSETGGMIFRRQLSRRLQAHVGRIKEHLWFNNQTCFHSLHILYCSWDCHEGISDKFYNSMPQGVLLPSFLEAHLLHLIFLYIYVS